MNGVQFEPSAALYAIIPSSVRYDPGLTANAKLLYGEITALSQARGYCFASNRYFAGLYGLTVNTISALVSQLADRGHVRVEIIKSEKGAVKERRIWVIKERDYLIEGGIPKIQDTPKNQEGPPENSGEGIPKNREENNTRVNSTVNNTPIAPKFILDKFADFAKGNLPLLAALLGFAEMRNKKKKPINTERSVNILLNKLTKLSSGDDAAMVEMLDEATLKGWSSVYAHDDGTAQAAKAPAKEVVPEW